MRNLKRALGILACLVLLVSAIAIGTSAGSDLFTQAFNKADAANTYTYTVYGYKLDGTEVELFKVEGQTVGTIYANTTKSAPFVALAAEYKKSTDDIFAKLGYKTSAKSLTTNALFYVKDNKFTAVPTAAGSAISSDNKLYLATKPSIAINAMLPEVDGSRMPVSLEKSNFTRTVSLTTYTAKSASVANKQAYGDASVLFGGTSYTDETLLCEITDMAYKKQNVFGLNTNFYVVTSLTTDGGTECSKKGEGSNISFGGKFYYGDVVDGAITFYPTIETLKYPITISGLGISSEDKFGYGDDVSPKTLDYYTSDKVKFTYAQLEDDTTGTDKTGYKITDLCTDSALQNKVTGEIKIDANIVYSNGFFTVYPELEAKEYDVHFYGLNQNNEYVEITTKKYKASEENAEALNVKFSDVSESVDTINNMKPEGRALVTGSLKESPEAETDFNGTAAVLKETSGELRVYFKYVYESRYAHIVYNDGNTNNYVKEAKYNDYLYVDMTQEEYEAQYSTGIQAIYNDIVIPEKFTSDYTLTYKTDDDGNIVYEQKQATDENGELLFDESQQPIMVDDTSKPIVDKDPKGNDTKRPYRNCEFIGWNYYYINEVVNQVENLPDQSEWIEGKGPVSDENGVKVTVTHIAVAQWKSDKDFFFRVYSSDTAADSTIYLKVALGKDFKLYYWDDNKPCTRSEMAINKDKAGQTFLFYQPTFEELTYTNADGSTETSKSLRIDAVFADNSMGLNVTFLTALLQTAAPLLKTLLGGI